jgi:hypothetical protein
MMHKWKFPVGERIGGLSAAEFINLISWQLMPRALEIRAFLDEGGPLGAEVLARDDAGHRRRDVLWLSPAVGRAKP